MREEPVDFTLMLRCPLNGLRLRLLTTEAWKALRGSSGSGADTGLICEDGSAIYPVRDGIPVLLTEERVVLEGSEAALARRFLGGTTGFEVALKVGTPGVSRNEV